MMQEPQHQLLEKARAALEAAQAATTAAQKYTDQLASSFSVAVSSMTGGSLDPFVYELSVFILAILVGYYVVWSVTPALHTPLMSVTNAISSVIAVGALLALGFNAQGSSPGIEGVEGIAKFFGFFALLLASINIFGGFYVTGRMLALYKKKGQRS